MSSSQTVVQLVVDASGAKAGVAEFEAAMERAKGTAVKGGDATANSFDQAMRTWTNSLAKADPAVRAQIKMQQDLERQTRINSEAVRLGIATNEAAAAQLDRVRAKHEELAAAQQRGTAAGTNFNSMLAVGRGALAAFGVAVSVGAIVQFGKEIFSSTAALIDQAQQIGVNVEALQAYRGVAQDSGIAVQQMDQILTRLTDKIGEAAAGAGGARSSFQALGISAHDLAGDTEDIMSRVATALLDISDASERARIETDLFGKSGQQLESALPQLAQSADDLTAAYARQGRIIDDEVVAKAKKAADELTVTWSQVKTGVTPYVVGLTTALLDLANAFTEAGRDRGAEASLQGRIQEMVEEAERGGWRAAWAAEQISVLRNELLKLQGLETGWSVQRSSSEGSLPIPENPYAVTSETNSALDDYIAKLAEGARLSSESAQQRAIENALIEAANVAQREINDEQRINVTTAAQARMLLSDDVEQQISDAVRLMEINGDSAKSAEQAAQAAARIEQQRQAAFERSVEGYGDYIHSLEETLRLSKLATDEREIEVDLARVRNQYADTLVGFDEERIKYLLEQIQLEDRLASFDKSLDSIEQENKYLEMILAGQKELVPYVRMEAELRALMGDKLAPEQETRLQELIARQKELNGAIAGQEDALDAAADATKEWTRLWDQAARSIQDTLGDAFEEFPASVIEDAAVQAEIATELKGIVA